MGLMIEKKSKTYVDKAEEWMLLNPKKAHTYATLALVAKLGEIEQTMKAK